MAAFDPRKNPHYTRIWRLGEEQKRRGREVFIWLCGLAFLAQIGAGIATVAYLIATGPKDTVIVASVIQVTGLWYNGAQGPGRDIVKYILSPPA